MQKLYSYIICLVILFLIFNYNCSGSDDSTMSDVGHNNTIYSSTYYTTAYSPKTYLNPISYNTPATLLPHPISSTAINKYGIISSYGQFLSSGSVIYPANGIYCASDDQEDVKTVEAGYIRCIYTSSHDPNCIIMIGNTSAGPGEGWLYSSIAEASITNSIGDSVISGQVIGKIADWGTSSTPTKYKLGLSKIVSIVPNWTPLYGLGTYYTANPLRYLNIIPDTTKPFIGDIYFCPDSTSTQITPDSLYGNIDIVVQMKDTISTTQIPELTSSGVNIYKAEFELYEYNNPTPSFSCMSFIFDGTLFHQQYINVVYKYDILFSSSVENSKYFYVVSNSNGNGIVDSPDEGYNFQTMIYPDGTYTIVVKASDYAGNTASKTIDVRIVNNGY